MPQPTSSDVHVSRPLTDLSVAYMQGASAFVADRVFPRVPVAKQADQYFVYSREDFFRIMAQKRAPATESAGGGYNLSTASYFCQKYAFHKDVDDDSRTNADAGLDMDRDGTEFVTLQLLLLREQIWFDTYFKAGVWGTDRAGSATPTGSQFLFWSDAGADPIADVRASCTSVLGKTGYKPNTLVLGPSSWNAIADHPSVLDRIKHTQRGVTTPEIVAQAAGLERILVAEAVRNTAAEGAAEATSFFASDNALLCYAAPRPGLMVPSAGYTFSWTGLLGAGALGNRIKKFRMEHLEADRIEGEMAFDGKLVAAELGVFFSDTVQ
jgi:hypothetical protein